MKKTEFFFKYHFFKLVRRKYRFNLSWDPVRNFSRNYDLCLAKIVYKLKFTCKKTGE